MLGERGASISVGERQLLSFARTIVTADEILVLHHGEVVERGTHGELVREAGMYERLWRLQLGEGEAPAISAGDRLPPVGAVR